MILLVGINGAGKTTFYYTKLKPFLDAQGLNVPFVNADEIEKANYPEDEIGQHSYAAAKQAARLREHCFETAQSFVTETVFSHQSKIDLIGQAQEKGFEVVLNHVHVSDPEKAIKRVHTRTALGGHAVPDNKVRERFPRTLKNLQVAAPKTDRAYVWDNNHQTTQRKAMHRFIFSMRQGKINKISERVPQWAMQLYANVINDYQIQKDSIIDAANNSLKSNDSFENKQRVLRILLNAGIQNDDIQTIFSDNGGMPN